MSVGKTSRRNQTFYRNRFEEWEIDPAEVDSLEALREVPFTMKDDKQACQELIDVEQALGDHQPVPTAALNQTLSLSGMTGKPTYFGLTDTNRQE